MLTEKKNNVPEGRNREKIVVPKKKILLPQSEFERRIDPLLFQPDADWLQHEPKSDNQNKIKNLFLDARANDRLHRFTVMAIDPSIDPDTGEVVYQPGLPPAVGYSYNWWVTKLEAYDRSRNSRVKSLTEWACENLELIRRLVEWKRVSVKEAWDAVCDHSAKLGHFADSSNAQDWFEPTGSREVCGFYDRGNVCKILAEDPWEKAGGFWAAGGCFFYGSSNLPLADLFLSIFVDSDYDFGLGQLALD